MPSENQIKEALKNVLVPGVGRSLVELNLLKSVEVIDGKIKVTLASAALGPGTQEWVKAKVQGVVEKIPDVQEITIDFVEAKAQELNKIDRVVSILSGKGGVGKSIVTALSAIALARQGNKVGILDADITGPSIPRMFGIKAHPIGSDTGILPIMSHLGIEIMSINLMLDREDDAVIWRGPVISGVIKQFWEEVLWGQLDYLLVDLPPGT
ncbi:MAG: P-loop NTPase, partial [Chloroflexi bacterium]|nr:P-loop NTPase [Chloroflexota bacterium]